MLFVLGALLGAGGGLQEVRFPVLGFEGAYSGLTRAPIPT
jgi:hypothetical protein